MKIKPNVNNKSVKLAQKKFRKWTAIKRNKEIFDIDEIDIIENFQEKQRRTPYKNTCASELSDRLNQSFMNSTTIFSGKLDNDIQKHKTKVGSTLRNLQKNTVPIYSTVNYFDQKPPQVRGVSMDKMISRKYRQSLDTKQDRHDRRFNNFQYMPVDDTKIRGFDKYLSREQLQKLRAQTVPDSNPQVPALFQKFNYASNTFNVNWEYKAQKWERGPIYFKLNEQNSANLHSIQDQKVEKGRLATTAKWNRKLINWKSFLTKDIPSQFERIYYTPNMNFRQKNLKVQDNGKRIKIRHEAQTSDFERWQLCDLKYFRLKSGKQKKRVRMHTQ